MRALRRLRSCVLGLIALAAFNTGDVVCWAETFEGKCIRVLDGDTVEVLRDGLPVKIRLDGIDCPEKHQAFGQKAKDFTAALVFKQEVFVDWKKKDRYGRIIGSVTLTDGRALNEELVRSGYAWWYREYSKSAHLANLEAGARLARVGLWNDAGPVPPWIFRKTQRRPIVSSFTGN
jgi:micrococcal nuclease